jgi:16S rRNA (guanine527-N7)-methyltransferase
VDALDAQLARARELGFLGPGPIEAQRAHAQAFLVALEGAALDRCVDLGSGGGLPGLALAVSLPDSSWVLVDAMRKRTAFLERAVDELELQDRVVVVTARAEEVGRDPAFRGRSSVVVARGFGPPAVTAECAAPLVRVGGFVVVSEPPDPDAGRWSAAGLAELGLATPQFLPGPPSLVRLRLTEEVPDRYPRRVGVPGKRPLW